MLTEKEAWQYIIDNATQYYHENNNEPFIFFKKTRHHGLCNLIDKLCFSNLISEKIHYDMISRIQDEQKIISLSLNKNDCPMYIWPKGELKPRIEFCKEMIKKLN